LSPEFIPVLEFKLDDLCGKRRHFANLSHEVEDLPKAERATAEAVALPIAENRLHRA
jgi:hypothetical protein